MNDLLAHMYVYGVCAWCPQRSKDCIRFLGTGDTDVHEPQHWY